MTGFLYEPPPPERPTRAVETKRKGKPLTKADRNGARAKMEEALPDAEIEQAMLWNLDPEDVVAPAGVDPAEHWGTLYRKLKALELRQNLMLARGLLIPRAEVEGLFVARAAAFKRGLELLEQRLIPRLVGLDDPQVIRQELRDGFRTLLRTYSRPRNGEAPEEEEE